MAKLVAVVAMMVLAGCADDGEREAHDFPTAPETQSGPVQDEVEPPPEPQVLRILEHGPLFYDVSALSTNQQMVVQQVMDSINLAAGVEALAVYVSNDEKRAYGVVNVHLAGCELADGFAGHASWNLGKMRSTICFEWKDERMLLKSIITHELLHTLGIGAHDDEVTSVMYEKAYASQRIGSHHVAHIRKLAGME